ncbi:LysR substrate-binding domain-containing protein [Microbacterium sp. bgisy203]|uniref:LysR substrate-binding domain-containing protein n=1 Tax=Microbacterium sp. bgisy203 TaxID=3413799 RepID=UPI003D75A3D0
MAAGRGGRGGQGKRPAGKRPATAKKAPSTKKTSATKDTAKKHTAKKPVPVASPALPPGPFRLGAIEGATPGKWIDVWRERMPGIPLDLVALGIADQRAALGGDTSPASVDAALVRLPIDREGLHVIPLYDELPVVVCAADAHLTAADELTADDLAGEVLITPVAPPLEVEIPGADAPRFAPPASVEEAIAIAASGVGIVVVPMSLARLHHRKDVDYRPLADGPHSTVALAWPARDAETPALVDAFIGIVRGRTANSSR